MCILANPFFENIFHLISKKSIRVAEEAKPEAVAHSDVRSFLRNLISGLDSLPNMELSTAQPLLETMVR